MMDAIVQLIRNGLCCIKDLEAFRDITLLWDPENTRYMLSTIISSMGGSGSSGNSNDDDDVQPSSLLDIPEPYNKTTPLEVLISIAQLYAVISLTISGYRMFMKNHTNYYRIRNLLVDVNNNNMMNNKDDDRSTNTTTVIQKTTTTKTTTTTTTSSSSSQQEEELVLNVSRRFVTESMINEGSICIRNMMTGIFLFFLGISFIWLFGNSWHVTETPYMGGIRGLILALLMAEICLLPLVYYMYVDANHMMKQSKQILHIAKKMENTTTRTTTTKDSYSSLNNNNKDAIQLDDIIQELSSFEILSSWIPFWSNKYVAPAGSKKDHLVDDDDDKALMEAERVQVQEMLSILISQLTTTIDQKDDKTAAATTTTTTTSSSSASLVLLRKRLVAATNDGNEYDEFVNDLLKRSNMIRYEGYREYLYLLCNAIAAYGYALGIIVYYYDKEHEHPYYIRSIVFHMNNQDAEWNGNFAGDLMWTIEPIIILLSPMIITYLMTTTNNHSTIHRRKNIQKKSSSSSRSSEDEQQPNQDAMKKKSE